MAPINLNRTISCSGAAQGGYSERVIPASVPYEVSAPDNLLFFPRKPGADWLIDSRAVGTTVDQLPMTVDNIGTLIFSENDGPYTGADYANIDNGGNLGYASFGLEDAAVTALGGGAQFTLEFYSKLVLPAPGSGPQIENNVYITIAATDSLNAPTSVQLILRSGHGIGIDPYSFSEVSFIGHDVGEVYVWHSVDTFRTGWHHIAVVVDGTDITLYLDGAALTPDETSVYPSSATFWEGYTWTGLLVEPSSEANGDTSIHGVRITNLALYTGAFTPPEFA